MLYWFLKPSVVLLFKIFFFFQAKGKEFIPKKGGFILASSHHSYIDPVALGVACPRKLSFMAKKELFKNKFFSHLIVTLGAFPIKRGTADIGALRQAAERVSSGSALVVFPQGTRNVNKDHGIKPGIGVIVRKSGVPVVCAKIEGSNDVIPSGGKKLHLFKKLKVSFSRPLYFDKGTGAKEIAEKILQTMYSL